MSTGHSPDVTLQHWKHIKMLRGELSGSLVNNILDALEARVGWSIPKLNELLYELLLGRVRDVERKLPSRTSVRYV